MASRSNGGGRKPSGSSKGNTAKNKAKTKTGNNKELKNFVSEDDSIRDEAILILILGICILVYLALFGGLYSFGKIISDILFGLFGIVSYIIPVVVFFATAFYMSNRGRGIAYIKVIETVILSLVFMALSQMLFDKDASISKITDYYTHCADEKKGGGIIGGTISHLLLNTIGAPGTYIVLIVLIIVCVVLITEKSLFKGVKHGSESIYYTAKDNTERYREHRDERRKHREEIKAQNKENIKRKDKHVSGVIMDTITGENVSPDDMHEISLNDSDDIPNINIRTVHNIDTTDEQDDIYEPDDLNYKEEPIRSRITEPGISDVYDDVEITSDSYNDLSQRINITGENIKGHGQVPAQEKQTEYNDSYIGNDKAKPETKIKHRTHAYRFPPVSLLKKGVKNENTESVAKLKETASNLQKTLKTFGVNVTITDIAQGPSVTRYEMQPEVGTKVSKITGLTDDIKLNMAAKDVRIEAPIPGKAAVGIEIPNKEVSTVSFRDLIESKEFKEASSKLSFAVGKDLSGTTVVADIAKMPHMLIAGSTGSGKSVCINTLIMSIIYKASPDDVKLIMVDPKVVELSVYNDIPHLMIPVVTDPQKAAAALNWGVAEMSERYKKFADLNVRDLKGYNKKIEQINSNGEADEEHKKLPQIVIIVDELADLMMVASNDVETAICRLAQLARAAGIHLVIATQRPSVDVITGLIKANMPSRIAFAVSSGVDSRTILDMNGAERLLGKGDMLFYPQGYSKPSRIQGAFISDEEINGIVEFLKANNGGEPSYDEEVKAKVESGLTSSDNKAGSSADSGSGSDNDSYFVDAARLVIEQDKASIGYFQRRFKIGFNRAARIMDQLYEAGIVSAEEGTKPRHVLMSMEQFENKLEQGDF